ncbi:hypothetical protein [Lysinibacillus endophyticus]|uniref:hypothetical protein n=1 Tax=Ureibacillus endophyticus TaxID=1978490 RepID=UPI0020A11384|nr:hypothetical protein [Lysinibacillus endophyticus]MCP1145794.1 hypothetical protein [Lysinibacillus endophyticus]
MSEEVAKLELVEKMRSDLKKMCTDIRDIEGDRKQALSIIDRINGRLDGMIENQTEFRKEFNERMDNIEKLCEGVIDRTKK